MLWRIQGPGLQRPSYLLGTVHSKDARAYRNIAPVLAAIDSCDVVAGELRMGSDSALKQMGNLSGLFLPPGTDLDDLLSPKQVKQVKAAMKETLGPMAGLFVRMKPFYLAAMLQEMQQPKDSAHVLDDYLQRVALARGKAIMGIETVNEQMDAVTDVPLKDQARMLYATVQGSKNEWDKLMNAYAAQDLDRLMRMTEDKDNASQAVQGRLVRDRNGVMATRMDSLMRDGRTFLFAVGAGHLAGKAGVIAQLRSLGYAVEPAVAKLP